MLGQWHSFVAKAVFSDYHCLLKASTPNLFDCNVHPKFFLSFQFFYHYLKLLVSTPYTVFWGFLKSELLNFWLKLVVSSVIFSVYNINVKVTCEDGMRNK